MLVVDKVIKSFPWKSDVLTEREQTLLGMLEESVTVDESTKVTEARGRRFIFHAGCSSEIVSFPSEYLYEIGKGSVKARVGEDDDWIMIYDRTFYLFAIPEGADIRLENLRQKSGYGYIRLKGDRKLGIKPIVITHRLLMLGLFVEGVNVLLTLGKGRKGFIRSLHGNKYCSSPSCLSLQFHRNFENWYVRRYCNNSRKNGRLDEFYAVLEANRISNWEEGFDYCHICRI